MKRQDVPCPVTYLPTYYGWNDMASSAKDVVKTQKNARTGKTATVIKDPAPAKKTGKPAAARPKK